MDILCIIPARGGSKGIPGKNIVPVAGLPLLAWSLLTTQKSKYINKIVVSTNDNKVMDVAQKYGGEVIIRPESISGDLASSESALIHVVEQLKTQNYHPSIVVFMQCTSPLTLADDIDGAISLFLQENADVVFSATPSHAFLWQSDFAGQAVGVNHNIFERPMRQERQPEWRETGAFYIIRTSGLIENHHRFFGKIMFYDVPPERSIDIDDKWEMSVAEFLLLRQCFIVK